MKYLTHNEIRNIWFSYFEKHGHKRIKSASLIPENDKSLLWVNAGVTPLKKYFDGREVPECRRIVDIQKCIRTNDVENVGITKRHQTFFEMMGNFSVGDYFRDEAIEFAFELLASPKYFDIDSDLLYVSVYPDDQETIDKWVEVGLEKSHLIPLETNFWEIGEGPCGPDTEIYFDRGEKYDPDGDALDKFRNDEEQERFVEIWNNVFSQFNAEEGVDRDDYKELPSKNIDTGAGLERFCLIFQNVDSNFDTDLFQPIIKHISELVGKDYVGQKEYKIIADHIRAITFALSDGAMFENFGRGYVLRRLLRRSVRFGKNVNIKPPFMYKLVSDVVDVMGEAYPDLKIRRPYIETQVLDEENLFLKTLEIGEKKLKEMISNSVDGVLKGEDAFKLYDTYGFPLELTQEYLSDENLSVDVDGFNECMNKQKLLAKANTFNTSGYSKQNKALLEFTRFSEFAYSTYRNKSRIIGLFKEDEKVDKLNEDGLLIVERTCFYATSGGQVNDTGMIIGDNFKARVVDVFKGPNGQNVHKVKILDGIIRQGDEVELIIDKDKRKRTEANHSCVHILQYSLQQIISDTIKQAGSYVDDEKLRFDFTYNGKISDDQIVEVEEFANKMIKQDIIVSTEIMPLQKAIDIGAMALFTEKYGDNVRVVKIGKSIELCGGTHVSNTKEIGPFACVSLESKGSNVYRIEAVSGSNLERRLYMEIKPYNDEMVSLLTKAKDIMSDARKMGIKLDFDVEIDNSKPTSYKDLIYNQNELSYVKGELKDLNKKYQDLKYQKITDNLDSLFEKVKQYGDVSALVLKTFNKEVPLLKLICDRVSEKINNVLVFIIDVKEDDSCYYVCKSTCDIDASEIIKIVSLECNGSGGGKKTFAQGGAKNIKDVDKYMKLVEKVLKDYE